jgi:hypothetical protein
VHVPATQVSICVHALASLHVVPSGRGGFEHAPVAGSQLPATWHWSSAVHVTGVPPVHTPAWQVSDMVHGLPSLQTVPLGAFGLEHVPVFGSQMPATWH